MKTADNEESRIKAINEKITGWKNEGYNVDELENKIKDVEVQIPQAEVKPSIFTHSRSRYMLGAVIIFVIITVITGAIIGSVGLTGSLFVGGSEEPEHADYIIEWINGCYVIKHKDTNTMIGEYSPQEFAELDVKAVPIPPLETATMTYPIYSVKVPDITDKIFFIDPDDLIYVHDPGDFTVPYEPPFVYIPDDLIAIPYDPPFTIIPPPIIITPDQ